MRAICEHRSDNKHSVKLVRNEWKIICLGSGFFFFGEKYFGNVCDGAKGANSHVKCGKALSLALLTFVCAVMLFVFVAFYCPTFCGVWFFFCFKTSRMSGAGDGNATSFGGFHPTQDIFEPVVCWLPVSRGTLDALAHACRATRNHMSQHSGFADCTFECARGCHLRFASIFTCSAPHCKQCSDTVTS